MSTCKVALSFCRDFMHNMKLSPLQGDTQEGKYMGVGIHMPVCTGQPKLRSLSLA